VRKSTLLAGALFVAISGTSLADAPGGGSSDITWTPQMANYVQNELQDAANGSDGGFWQQFCHYFPGACPGTPGGPGPQNVPEPGTLALFTAGLGLMGVSVYRRRTRHIGPTAAHRQQ
jgi:PEP-CTERM motif